jgi:hypothetical protein
LAFAKRYFLSLQNPRNQSRRVVVEDGFDVPPLGEAEFRAGNDGQRALESAESPSPQPPPIKWERESRGTVAGKFDSPTAADAAFF